MEHDRDDEYDDFEAILDRQAGVGEEIEWKKSKPESETTPEVGQETPQEKSAEGVVDSSTNDTSTKETHDRVRSVESVSASDVESEIAELTDAELELLTASQAPLAESDPNHLRQLLSQNANEPLERHSVVRVQLTPDIVTRNGDGTTTINPGWAPTRIKVTQVSSKDIPGLDAEEAEMWERALYNSSQLTLDQVCETIDKMELEIRKLIRERNAHKLDGHIRTKALRAEGKISAKEAKQREIDLTTPPGSRTEFETKKAKRSGVSSEPAVKKVSAKQKSNVETLYDAYGDYKMVVQALQKGNNLTPELLEYITGLEKNNK